MPATIEASRSDLTVRIGRLDLHARRDPGRGYWFALLRGNADVELIVGNAAVTVSWGIIQDTREVPIFALRRAQRGQSERQPAPAE